MWKWKFLGQVLHQQHSNLSHCNNNARFLTCCTTRKLQLMLFNYEKKIRTINSVEEEEIFLYHARLFWLVYELTLDRLTGENQSLITCIYRRDLGKLSNSPNGQSLRLKHHPQLKKKEDIEGGNCQLRKVTRKCSVNKGKVIIALSSDRVSRDLVIFLF